MSEDEENNRILDMAQEITVKTKEDFEQLSNALRKVDWSDVKELDKELQQKQRRELHDRRCTL